jgi:alpha-L-rhamnosidase
MIRRSGAVLSLILSTIVLGGPMGSFADVEQLEQSFKQPPDDARIMMRWWWFGPAVTRPQLEREMNLMKAGGIGGIEVQPVYPLAVDDEASGIKNLTFLSPAFLDAVRFTAAKAKDLGLRFDLTLGSGWPYGGPMFPIHEAAGRLRFQKVPVEAGQRTVPAPPLREGDVLFAAFAGPMQGNATATDGYREVEIRDNAARLPADLVAASDVLFFVAGHTGMKVKRAAVGAEGYVIDHYDPAVIAKFLETVADPLMVACRANPPYSVFCDSLEVGGEDWTPSFLAEFQRRRGYDLRPYLPALVTDTGEKSREIRHDWGKTLTELFNDRFITVFQKWSNEHQTRFRIQGYGTPPAALSSFANADLNEGEGFTWKGFRESRWAASASHLLGRSVTSSETWTWLHSPVFRATPLDMKAEADLHFLQGVNQLIGHGWPYTPPGVEAPGWRFYASAVFNEKNPWWIVMPDVSRYLQRVSHVLRHGNPANDVALYLSDSDAWARFGPGRVSMNNAVSEGLGRDVIRQILEAGYNLDFFDDPLLDLRGRVDDGTLAFGEVRYKAVVLPGVERIPASTLRKLDEFARGGGIVIATRRLPARAPGLKASDEDQEAVKDLTRRLFERADAPGVFVPSEGQIGEVLSRRLRPDVAFASPAPDIGFVHRHTAEEDVYFLANTSNVRQRMQATFRVTGSQPEWWNPLTGGVEAAEVIERSPYGTAVAVDLEPYGSRLLVFSARRLTERPRNLSPPPIPPALDMNHGWTVTFGEDKPPVAMQPLQSWTDAEATRHFSGIATYRTRVNVPDAMLADGLRQEIDFGAARALDPAPTVRSPGMRALVEGPVREAAALYVNDKPAGVVWCPPYNIDVTGLLERGENRIRVEVANLALNRMAGQPLPDYRELKARYGDRFQPQDMDKVQPIPAGLMGPVRLVPSAVRGR